MDVTFIEHPEKVQIDDAKMIFKHFADIPDDFHRAGERDFHIVIPNEEIANAFIDKGYNVVIKPPRSEDEEPFMKLKVKINFKSYNPPNVYLVTNGRRNKLDEESIACLDKVEISSVRMDIRPYDWGPINGKSGRTAYLSALEVVQEVDRFEAEYAEEEHPEDDIPF